MSERSESHELGGSESVVLTPKVGVVAESYGSEGGTTVGVSFAFDFVDSDATLSDPAGSGGSERGSFGSGSTLPEEGVGEITGDDFGEFGDELDVLGCGRRRLFALACRSTLPLVSFRASACFRLRIRASRFAFSLASTWAVRCSDTTRRVTSFGFT